MTTESRDEALDLFEQSSPGWLAAARAWAMEHGKGGRIVTINDVRRSGPPIPENVDPRVAGAVFRCRETWEFLGYGPSNRRVSHGRPVARFRLVGASA